MLRAIAQIAVLGFSTQVYGGNCLLRFIRTAIGLRLQKAITAGFSCFSTSPILSL